MAHYRSRLSDGVFWGAMGALMAGTMGGAIGYVFALFYGAGWVSGAALGAVVFIIAAFILSRVNGSALPPPNSLRAPVAPPGGAFQAPPGGKFATPGVAPAPRDAAEPEPMPSMAEVGHNAGAAVDKAVYGASAAVSNAAAAAKAAIADFTEPDRKTDRAADAESAKPPMIDAPRNGTPDNLKKIKGVGPKLEDMLHGHGIYHFDQIAAWGPAELAWVDSNLEGFNGRATRDDWVGQARILANGGTTDFADRVERGEDI